ncbi:MAG: GTP cyclohydrolase I [Candidatus Nitrosocosmicus sp.]
MTDKDTNENKKSNQQQQQQQQEQQQRQSFYNNELYEFNKIVQGYYKLIGGDDNKYNKETSRRLMTFGEELLRKRSYEKFTTFKAEHDDMIIGNHLRLFSFCEHHLLPFFGEVAIGYIPDSKIFGLSKFQRLIDKVSSRPQLQERLTYQILDEINNRLKPKGIAVVIKAIHTCVFARGTQSSTAEFTTSAVEGVFKENINTKNEFLSIINADGRLRL